MEKKGGEQAFCRAYLACMDAQRAARAVGAEDGFALLRKKSVQSTLAKMRGGEGICREDVLRRLGEIAFARANDAVKLVVGEGMTAEEIDALELGALAEFKRGTNGAFEVKFFDRVKALELLCTLLGGGDEGSAAAEFFRSLGEEDGAWED